MNEWELQDKIKRERSDEGLSVLLIAYLYFTSKLEGDADEVKILGQDIVKLIREMRVHLKADDKEANLIADYLEAYFAGKVYDGDLPLGVDVNKTLGDKK